MPRISRKLGPSVDPDVLRHQTLIEKKYTQGLTSEDVAELAEVEAGFDRRDAAFYAPILARVAAARRALRKVKTGI